MISKQGQSFLDMVIQATGDIDNAFAMSLANGVSMSDRTNIGQTINPIAVTNQRIQSLFSEDQIPATALSNYEQLLSQPNEGIGQMIVGETFIVG